MSLRAIAWQPHAIQSKFAPLLVIPPQINITKTLNSEIENPNSEIKTMALPAARALRCKSSPWPPREGLCGLWVFRCNP
jgi:hypothetical protein